MKALILISSAVFVLFISACNHSSSTDTPSPGNGFARINFPFADNSTFSAIARVAVITVSAKDFETKTFTLSITDSTVEGLLEEIPEGVNRYFEVSVFDSLEVLQYQGSAYADVFADTTIRLDLQIKRVTKNGNVFINGTIDEELPTPKNELIAYYPFSGNADDESENSFDGTVKGATLTSDRFGEENRAYFFDGTSGILADVTTAISTSSFTLTAWLKHNGKKSERVPRIVAVATPGSVFGYHELLFANGYWRGDDIDYSQKLITYISNAQARDGYDLYYSKSAADTTSWHHAAVTFNGETLTYYLDGAVDTAIAVTKVDRVISDTAEIQIGFSPGHPGCGFNGSLDEIRIYNYPLTAEEISSLFEGEE